MPTITGTSYSDTLIGTPDKDKIYGRSGNDWLYGRGSEDYLSGGSGNDYLDGEAGLDDLEGGSGEDKLYGGGGEDYLSGKSGDDYLDGEAGQDALEGGSGADKYVILFQGYSPDTGPGVNGDTIIGFNGNEGDKIDLSNIDAIYGPFGSVVTPVQEAFNVNQLSYFDGVLHADVINGPDVEIALVGAPSLNILTDVIL